MNITDLGRTVSKFAPLLGTVLAGPGGAAVGTLVAHAFGGDINDTDKLITNIIQDPEAQVKLAEIESTQKVELQKLVIQSENQKLVNQTQQMQIDEQDTADARAENSKTQTLYPQVLSTVVILGFFLCIYWIAAFKQENADHDVLYLLMGGVSTAFASVVNYWLGTSYGQNFFSSK